MKELLRVETGDGKYTIIQYQSGSVDILRHGEPWQENTFNNINVILALAYDLEAARLELKEES